MIDKLQVTVQQLDGWLHMSLHFKFPPRIGESIHFEGKTYKVVDAEWHPENNAHCDLWVQVIRIDGIDSDEEEPTKKESSSG